MPSRMGRAFALASTIDLGDDNAALLDRERAVLRKEFSFAAAFGWGEQ